MTGKDRKADRHTGDSQVQIAARIDRDDYDRLDRLWPVLGLPSRRQAIIRAIREFIERNEEPSGRPRKTEQQTATEDQQ